MTAESASQFALLVVFLGGFSWTLRFIATTHLTTTRNAVRILAWGFGALITGQIMSILRSLDALPEPEWIRLPILGFGAFLVVLGVVQLSRRAEEAYRALEDRDRRLLDFLESSSDFFWEVDADLRYTYVSHHLRDLAQIEPDELIGKELGETPIHADDNEAWRDRIAITRRREAYRDIPITTPLKDGSKGIMLISGRPIFDGNGNFLGYRGVGRSNLQQERERATRIATDVTLSGSVGEDFFDAMTEALVRIGYDIAFIGRVSREHRDRVDVIAGHNQQGIIDTFTYDLDGAPCRRVIDGEMTIIPKGVAGLYPRDEPLARKGVEAYGGVPIRDTTGAVTGLLVVLSLTPFRDEQSVRDVLSIFSVRAGAELARVKNDEDKEVMQRQLLHSQKMETMGMLAGGIAHDFNNILTPILGYAEMLMEDFPKDSEPHDDASAIYRGAKRARAMIEQILAFSRRNETEQTLPFAPRDQLAEAIKFMRGTIPASIDLELDVAENTLDLFGDPGKFDQVIMNLVTNAWHAIGETNGRIGIVAYPETVEASFANMHPPLKPGPCVRIEVRDTGSGIPERIRQMIFDPFFTTKGSGRGTGFGLSTVRGIVESMEGAILVDSTEGVGTVFTILLPAHIPIPDQAASPQLSDGTAISRSRSKGQIVYVDDEAENNVMVMRRLERSGYSVVTFDRPGDALPWLLENGDEVDVLITDDSMPNIQGHQLAADIKSRHRHIGIVVVSGTSGGNLKKAYSNIPGVRFVSKPFSLTDLVSAIELCEAV